MADTELAWAAGFFDGEGSVTTSNGSRCGAPRKTRPTLNVTVGQSGSPVLLERFRDAVGVGRISGPYIDKRSNRQPKWAYNASGKNGHRVMELLRPYLGPFKVEKYDRLREVVV